MKIYLATSWRNPYYASTLDALKAAGHDVYDFKSSKTAFSWQEVGLPGPSPHPVSAVEQALESKKAGAAWYADYAYLINADVCVLLLPAGNSAHLEAGLADGKGVPVLLYVPEQVQSLEPELMWCTFRIEGKTFYRSMQELQRALQRELDWIEAGRAERGEDP